VSPHLDDVAASCSGRILQQVDNGESVLIVTVFTATPVRGPTLFSNDLKPILNYKRRREEDTRAMQRMGVDYLWLEHPEFLFRNKRPWVRFPTGQPDDRRKAHQDRGLSTYASTLGMPKGAFGERFWTTNNPNR